MKRYFISGTDTDCGKTFVSCRLLDYFQAEGESALAIKPIVSGAIEAKGQWVYEELLRLSEHNPSVNFAINKWHYALPAAPHLAARQEGEILSASQVHAFCEEENFKAYEHLIIEGAGGLMVPLNEEETWLDFLKLSQIPVILVVGMRLGCINHALLTAEALQSHKIACLGWIANVLDPNMLLFHENLDYLIKKMPMPLIATVPFQTPKDKAIHVSKGHFTKTGKLKAENP